ncbi:MAG: hypothetical protein A2W61_01385 [Deltaproteobacteria bacterium RIFCSPLOWO2_01_44_7]|nr:MAG: hypothetical protein A2W61_01385 [Deltaproteobacteria bacterium RIFCSPLOWO2_01_44_7]
MGFHDQSVVQKIRIERKKGTSIKNLERKFGVPETTVSRWVRDIPSASLAFNSARKREILLKAQLHHLTGHLTIDENLAKIFVSLLYWCEGSKHPSTSYIAFSNSDYRLVKIFLEFLRQGFKIHEDEIKVHLQLHSTHSQQEMTKFWSNLLDVPLNQFYKPTITNPTRKMKRLDYKGTCTIKYFDVKLLLNIMGLYEGLSNKE